MLFIANNKHKTAMIELMSQIMSCLTVRNNRFKKRGIAIVPCSHGIGYPGRAVNDQVFKIFVILNVLLFIFGV